MCAMPLIERNYDLNIWTFVRPDPYPLDLLKKMRSAGFTWVAMGIESFVDTVRDGVNKKWGQKKLAETIQRYNDAGINIIANFIFGLPDDTYETMNATLDMAMEYNFEYVDFYTCMAYPGSKLYTDSIKGGLEPNKTWHSYSQLGTETRPLPSKYLSSMEILKFRDEAFIKYFRNEKYLTMINEKFGKKAVEHINDMLKIKLERNIITNDLKSYERYPVVGQMELENSVL